MEGDNGRGTGGGGGNPSEKLPDDIVDSAVKMSETENLYYFTCFYGGKMLGGGLNLGMEGRE